MMFLIISHAGSLSEQREIRLASKRSLFFLFFPPDRAWTFPAIEIINLIILIDKHNFYETDDQDSKLQRSCGNTIRETGQAIKLYSTQQFLAAVEFGPDQDHRSTTLQRMLSSHSQKQSSHYGNDPVTLSSIRFRHEIEGSENQISADRRLVSEISACCYQTLNRKELKSRRK